MAMKRMSTFAIFGLLAPALLGTAQGESLILDEITVRGEKQQTNEENLTVREVRESPSRDIGEALQYIPGMSMVRKGAIANDVVLRGFQRDNLNMFLDGVRLHGGCPSRMDPPSFHFDFAEVESVEITKGPYDLKNPGGMAGTVNAISRTPTTGPGADVNLSYGSYNYVDASATSSYGGEQFTGLIGYSHKYSDVPKSGDGKRLTDIYPANSPNRYRPENLDEKAYGIDTVWLKGGAKLGDRGRSEISYSFQDAEDVLYPALLMDADYDRTHRVNWTSTLDNPTNMFSKVFFQVYFNRVDHLMSDTERMSSMPNMKVTKDYMMQTDAETTTFGGKLHGDLILGTGTFSTGIDFYERNWNATNEVAMWKNYTPQPMIPDVDINNYGVFGEYHQPLFDSVTVSGGVRVDYTTTTANDLSSTRLAALYEPYGNNVLDNENDFTELSANLQLTWQATDRLEIFTGIASASRPPDQQELYIGLQRMSGKNWIGNPDLEATRNNQIDFGAKWTTDTLFTSTSVFYSSLDDYITLTNAADPDGGGMLLPAKTYQNVDATIWGVEFGSQIALPYDVFLKATMSYVRGENSDTDQPLSEIPPLSGIVSLRYDNGFYFFEISERMAARQDRVDALLNEEETAGYAVTDLKGGVTWKNWDLVGGINNLFDKQYYNYLSYQRDPFQSGEKVPETGLFMYVNLRYRF
ncbi:MAG: TonB-dependent receptor [Desulfofustis sp.]|nr:TonB-dependent receptor [Desulfofustis sp.]